MGGLYKAGTDAGLQAQVQQGFDRMTKRCNHDGGIFQNSLKVTIFFTTFSSWLAAACSDPPRSGLLLRLQERCWPIDSVGLGICRGVDQIKREQR